MVAFFLQNRHFKKLVPFISALIFAIGIAYILSLNNQITNLKVAGEKLKTKFAVSREELNNLKNQDQYKINQSLLGEIKDINSTYNQAVIMYEKILDLKQSNQKTEKLDEMYAQSLRFLADKNYASATGTLNTLNKEIDKQNTNKNSPPAPPTGNNNPLSPGYSRQQVKTEAGNFLTDIISADLNSTKVIVDTASEGDCNNDCPVMSLSEYTSRNNAFAGINGSYFCPAAYPSCAGKTNSFDTLLMNKNKRYFNSDNNVYSNVPAVIFSGNTARFVSKSLEWGRDTGVDAVLANYPLLLLNGEVTFGGSGDTKHNNKGPRGFIGTTDSTVYIGIIHNATLTEAVTVLKTLGMKNALNLDSGGSSALWSGGYKYGPGRSIPNAILFIKK